MDETKALPDGTLKETDGGPGHALAGGNGNPAALIILRQDSENMAGKFSARANMIF
jgi:hypothetical protein